MSTGRTDGWPTRTDSFHPISTQFESIGGRKWQLSTGSISERRLKGEGEKAEGPGPVGTAEWANTSASCRSSGRWFIRALPLSFFHLIFFGGPRERCFGAAVKNERLASSVGVSRSATKRKWVETKKGIKEDATRKNRKRKRRRRRERMRSEKNQRDATQDWNEKIKINKGGEEVFVPAR